ncbi:MAG: hypothetical protein GTO16_11065 [Candidatus Aminicenantes bacterium]|nr:hypothetical protein [Candidatus Aminicenantes bacterium]
MVGKEPTERIFQIENHNLAFSVWQKERIRDRILIHIDSHLDFGWIPDKKLYKILLSNSLREENPLSSRKVHWYQHEKEIMKTVNTGNYLYPALKDGVIRELYWVVPDKIWDMPEERAIIKKIFRQILEKNPKEKAAPILSDENTMIATICGRKFTTCKLDNLPKIRESVLLDIDVDFFIVNSRLEEKAGITPPNKKPWMWPSELIALLKDKRIKTDCVTISYSVAEGFTPLEYKYLGDQVTSLLRNPNEITEG